MSYLKWTVIVCIAATSSACVRDQLDYAVPLGHPADAGGRSGAVLVGTNSLEPELQTVRPQVGTSPAPTAPASGGHQH